MIINKRFITTSIAISLLTTSLFSKELKTVFIKTFGGSKKDKAYGAVALNDGGALLVGTSKSFGKQKEQMLITRINSKGKTLFSVAFGNKQKDEGKAISLTGDGNYIAVGSSESYSKYGDKDLFVVKINSNGKKIWQKVFGGNNDDEAFDVVGTGNGGALIVGYSESFGHGSKDIYVLFIDKNGKEIWSKFLGGEEDDVAYSIALGKDGFYIAGYTESFGAGGQDFFLLKYNLKGKLQYTKVYGGDDDDVFKSVVATKDGGCAVAGFTKSFDAKRKDIDIIRFSKNGKMLWHKIYGFKSKEWANSITTTKEGGFLVVGTTKSFGFGDYDFYMLELNKKGSSKWANVYGGGDKDIAHKVISLKDGSYLVVGETESFGNGDYDFMEIKLKREK